MAKSLEDYPRSVQTAILAGVALLLGGAVAWYFVLPLWRSCTSLHDQVGVLHAQNATNQSLERQGSVYRQRIQEAETQLAALRSKVPDDSDPGSLLTLVHDAEVASGVHVRSLATEAPVAAEVYVELPAKLHVDGEYFAMRAFFERLGQATRITNVSDLALSVPAPAMQGSYKIAPRETVAADFVLSTYYNRPAGGPAPAAPPKK